MPRERVNDGLAHALGVKERPRGRQEGIPVQIRSGALLTERRHRVPPAHHVLRHVGEHKGREVQGLDTPRRDDTAAALEERERDREGGEGDVVPECGVLGGEEWDLEEDEEDKETCEHPSRRVGGFPLGLIVGEG